MFLNPIIASILLPLCISMLDRFIGVKLTLQMPQFGECQSSLLYTRLHFIRYTTTKWCVTTQAAESILFCKNWGRVWSNPVLKQHFTALRCIAYPRLTCAVRPIEKNLQRTWVFIRSHNIVHIFQVSFLCEKMSPLSFSHEDWAMSITISMT